MVDDVVVLGLIREGEGGNAREREGEGSVREQKEARSCRSLGDVPLSARSAVSAAVRSRNRGQRQRTPFCI